MKTILFVSCVVLLVTCFLFWTFRTSAADFPDHPRTSSYAALADALQDLVRKGSTPEDQDNGRVLQRVEEALKALPPESYLSRTLASLLEGAKESETSAKDRERINREIQQIIADLRFRPRAEAALPEGFPTWTPVGEVELKRYPAFRFAVTEQDGLAFWRLFAHIKNHNVRMTAPVVMTLAEDGKQPVLMAFLYERPDQESLVEEGRVSVRDQVPGWFVSTGNRGERNERTLKDAQERLRTWLSWFGTEWEIAGSPRVLAYNSPFAPRDQTYWEYQVPVRRHTDR